MEGVALAFGGDPERCIRSDSCMPDIPVGLPREAMHIVRMAERGRLEGDRAEGRPVAFMRWTQTVGLRFHP